MSNNKIPIVFGLVGFGILTLIGGGIYFRKFGKEWIRETEAYDKAVEEETREKQARLTQQLEEYNPDYADEEGLFGSSSSDSDEKISDLFLRNEADRDSFSDKEGGSRKNRGFKKNLSKRKRREKRKHTIKKRKNKTKKKMI